MNCSELSVKNFFTHFIYKKNLDNETLSKRERIIVRVAQVALCILTLGSLPLFCYWIWGQHQTLSVEKKTSEISVEQPPLPSATAPSEPVLPKPQEVPRPYSPPPVSLLQKIVHVAEPVLIFNPKSRSDRSFAPIASTEHYFGQKLCHFLLNDFVGGEEGGQFDAGIQFITHYIDRYSGLHPEDLSGKAVLESLKDYETLVGTNDMSLEEVSTIIWSALEKRKHVIMHGGFNDSDGGGHALFYEWSLSKQLSPKGESFQLTRVADSGWFTEGPAY